jgi:Tol biopolymer transport system component
VPASPEVRLDITTPPTPVPPSLAMSPDGRAIVFVASTPDGRSRLWLRALESGSARQLPGTDTAQHPFWSPDSRSVGFFADSTLKRIDIDGGSIRGLTNIYRGTGGTWSRNGVILVSSLGDPIARVSATGGEHAELSGLFQQGSNFSPYFLPDGSRFLYYVRGTPEVRGVYVGQLDGTLPPRRLTDADNPGVAYSSSGYLLFVRQRTLYAQRFDPAALTLTGDPFPIAPGCGCVGISASDNGSVAYRTTSGAGRRQFAWFDRSGNEIGKVVDSGGMSSPSLSPDGQHVVGYRGNPVDGNIDVWLLDVRRGAFTRLTDDVGDDVGPVWSPDGTRIAFASNRKGTHDIYQKPASGGGREELVFSDPNEKGVSDWSPDGRFVLFDRRELKKRSDVWALPLNGNGKPVPVSNSDFEELRAQFSPDGNWVAYQSDESGRHEIYLQPFPGPGRKSPVSTAGGSQVRWRRDGKELFYVALDGRLMAVPVALASNGQAPVIGTPAALFTPPLGGLVQIADFRPQYMVSPDGQRFLIATFAEGPLSPITVILNWKPKP